MFRRFREILLSASLLTSLFLPRATPVLAAQQGPSGWRQLEGPGGRLTHLVATRDGSDLYAIAVAGVNRRADNTQWFDSGQVMLADSLYQSRDLGRTWTPHTNDLPPGRITDILVQPATGDLFVALDAGEQGGIRRRAAGESTWRKLDLGRDDLVVRSLAAAADGETVYAGAIENGEFPRSYVLRGAGTAWSSAEVFAEGDPLAAVVAHPSEPGRLFATSQGGAVSISTDGGQTWQTQQAAAAPDTSGTPNLPALLAFDPRNPDNGWQVNGGQAGLDVRRTRDGGLTWSDLPASGLPRAAAAQTLAAIDGALLLNTSLGSYRSVDEGRRWQPLEGALSAGGVSEFLPLPERARQTGTLAATGYGLFVSRDEGAIWQPWGAGLPLNARVRGLLTHPGRPGAAIMLSDNRLTWPAANPPVVLTGSDAGKRWTPSAGLPEVQFTAWAVDPADAARIYLATSDAVYVSSDAGVSWRTKGLPAGSRNAIAVAADGGTVYVAGAPVMRSTDRGESWQPLPVESGGVAVQMVSALAVDPGDGRHVWAGSEAGVLESRDGGARWEGAGLEARSIRWLAATVAGRLYAGVADDGVYRRDGGDWAAASSGLPPGSTILAFLVDQREGGTLWATRDGGGVYRSDDWGDTWENAGPTVGDNLGTALALDHSAPGGVLLGTTNAGILALGSDATPPPASPTPQATAAAAAGGPGVNARIELVWPHDFAPVGEAKLANVGVRLFAPSSLRPPACGWRPKVSLWQAQGTDPLAPVKEAEQRSVDGKPFPYWEVNDVDVSAANDPNQKTYFLVKVEGIEAATSVWAHAADARTYFPVQDAPSGIAGVEVDEVDARVQIVWPHDGMGNEQPVETASFANVAVAFFKHGTRLSVPPAWRPDEVTLYGAWNQEVSRPLATQAVVQTRQAGAITYPVWEFNNIPVDRAAEEGSKLYLWAEAAGVATYPTIWAHGVDSRTFFPAQDEPIQGCAP